MMPVDCLICGNDEDFISHGKVEMLFNRKEDNLKYTIFSCFDCGSLVRIDVTETGNVESWIYQRDKHMVVVQRAVE